MCPPMKARENLSLSRRIQTYPPHCPCPAPAPTPAPANSQFAQQQLFEPAFSNFQECGTWSYNHSNISAIGVINLRTHKSMSQSQSYLGGSSTVPAGSQAYRWAAYMSSDRTWSILLLHPSKSLTDKHRQNGAHPLSDRASRLPLALRLRTATARTALASPRRSR
jgi:hypothetical protein